MTRCLMASCPAAGDWNVVRPDGVSYEGVCWRHGRQLAHDYGGEMTSR
jgi:hypothetical protein